MALARAGGGGGAGGLAVHGCRAPRRQRAPRRGGIQGAGAGGDDEKASDLAGVGCVRDWFRQGAARAGLGRRWASDRGGDRAGLFDTGGEKACRCTVEGGPRSVNRTKNRSRRHLGRSLPGGQYRRVSPGYAAVAFCRYRAFRARFAPCLFRISHDTTRSSGVARARAGLRCEQNSGIRGGIGKSRDADGGTDRGVKISFAFCRRFASAVACFGRPRSWWE